MSDFPALEVLTSGGHGHAPGTRLRIDKLPFIIGRGRDNPLPIQAGLVSRRHCEVFREFERWWLRDLGATNGTFHLGERIHDTELVHGDVFEVGGHCAFRFLLHESVDLRDAAMEQAILEEPDDDRRWSVYADWLQEHGSPLGERMANHRPADDRRWLGAFATFVVRGELEVGWAHGLPARVVVRTSELQGHSWDRHLGLLVRQPEFRFLRGLDLDVGAFRLEAAGAHIVDALGVDALPMLERVTIGPAVRPLDQPGVKALLDERRSRYPRFVTTIETLFVSWRPATLSWNEQVFELRPGVTFHVGPRGSDLEFTSACPAFGLILLEGRWRLTVDSQAKAVVKLNGVARTSAFLRPGDVIEPLEGVLLRFDA